MPEQDLGCTPSQTIGPFLHMVLPWPDGPDVVPDGTPGAIRIVGRLTDGAGEPVPDGLIETWQADPAGRFAHPDDPRGPAEPGFRGFGRCPTDADGEFWFRTVKPGPLPAEDGRAEAPHLDVTVFA
ncbi:MAG: protocatechuate 3,4-dioxygenase subunit alpha, partial [Mycobacteriales bacterium]